VLPWLHKQFRETSRASLCSLQGMNVLHTVSFKAA
jgi:hypothetical protein